MQKIVIGGEDLTKGTILKESAQDMYTFQYQRRGRDLGSRSLLPAGSVC